MRFVVMWVGNEKFQMGKGMNETEEFMNHCTIGELHSQNI